MTLLVLAKEDCFAPEENLKPNSAGLKSSRTRRIRHKSLEENHSAWIKERSLIGHIMCSEETPKKILESDILTEVGALYKVSPSKFVLVFGSKTPKEKLAGTEIQCRFSDSEVCLNFRKRVGPLRNWKETVLDSLVIRQWDLLSPILEKPCLYFGPVFNGRHGFNRKTRNGKKHVKIFPRGRRSNDTTKENFFSW